MGDSGCGVGDFVVNMGDFHDSMGDSDQGAGDFTALMDSDYCMGVFRFNGRLYLLTEKYA